MLIFLDLLLLFTGMYIVLTMAEEITVQYMLVFIILSLVLTSLGSYFYFRRRFIGFSNEVCRNTEEILHGHSIKEQQNKETLTSKMIMELEKIEDIFSFQIAESQNEKKSCRK